MHMLGAVRRLPWHMCGHSYRWPCRLCVTMPRVNARARAQELKCLPFCTLVHMCALSSPSHHYFTTATVSHHHLDCPGPSPEARGGRSRGRGRVRAAAGRRRGRAAGRAGGLRSGARGAAEGADAGAAGRNGPQKGARSRGHCEAHGHD